MDQSDQIVFQQDGKTLLRISGDNLLHRIRKLYELVDEGDYTNPTNATFGPTYILVMFEER